MATKKKATTAKRGKVSKKKSALARRRRLAALAFKNLSSSGTRRRLRKAGARRVKVSRKGTRVGIRVLFNPTKKSASKRKSTTKKGTAKRKPAASKRRYAASMRKLRAADQRAYRAIVSGGAARSEAVSNSLANVSARLGRVENRVDAIQRVVQTHETKLRTFGAPSAKPVSSGRRKKGSIPSYPVTIFGPARQLSSGPVAGEQMSLHGVRANPRRRRRR